MLAEAVTGGGAELSRPASSSNENGAAFACAPAGDASVAIAHEARTSFPRTRAKIRSPAEDRDAQAGGAGGRYLQPSDSDGDPRAETFFETSPCREITARLLMTEGPPGAGLLCLRTPARPGRADSGHADHPQLPRHQPGPGRLVHRHGAAPAS